MFKFILPNGERVRVELWVYREWARNRSGFFDSELGEQLDSATRIVRYR
jgi:hypothetical protein